MTLFQTMRSLEEEIRKLRLSIEQASLVGTRPVFQAHESQAFDPGDKVEVDLQFSEELPSFSLFKTPEGDVFAVPRDRGWRRVADEYLKANPFCVVCSSKEGVVAHHIIPVHVCQEKELVAENLITLCPREHLLLGHLGDWRSWNPKIVKDAKRLAARIKARPYKENKS